MNQAIALHTQKQQEIEAQKVRIINKGGGRKVKLSIEEQILLTLIYLRHLTTFQLLETIYQPKFWAGLPTLVMLVRLRHLWNKTTREVQFYLTSLHSDAQLIGRAIRKHWGIENEAQMNKPIISF